MQDVFPRNQVPRSCPITVALAVAAMLAVQACESPVPTASGEPGAARRQSGAVPAYGAWQPPVNLGPPISEPLFAENRPFITSDDDQLFFTSNRPAGSTNGFDIWMSTRDTETAAWGTPVNLGPVINTGGNDLAPFLSRDGKLLYFARSGECGNVDLWVARRNNKHDDTGWDDALHLGCELNSAAQDADPSYIADESGDGGTLHFLSNRVAANSFDIYASRRDTKQQPFGAATPVTELNSPAEEFKIVIRDDGLEAFIGSAREGSSSLDIWVATRADRNEPWGAPVNLGPIVNSTARDAPGSLSADGTTLYFQTQRDGGPADVWVTRRARLQ